MDKNIKKDEVVLIWRGNKLPGEDCKVVFKNKLGKVTYKKRKLKPQYKTLKGSMYEFIDDDGTCKVYIKLPQKILIT